MKSLRKDVLLDNDQVESTLIEKKILENLNFPFLVGMVWCFQTQERIFFVMPFIQGGELFQLLKTLKKFDENQVKFYAAIIGMSLNYLHNNGIIYRDIKPENILLENDGYLKLVDFGLAKFLKKNERTSSFCGTPEYVAPEIIIGEGHDANADWWSYGILVYEMLFGIPPFFNDNNEKMFDQILNSDVRFPKKIKISEEAKDFICKLLVKDEDKRLGANGFDEIKNHPFFKDLNFDDLLEKKIKAPFTPTVDGKLDIQYFDKEFTNEEVKDSLIPEKNLDYIKRNQSQFDEFNS
jgi:serum/glucocorticoid-regulated kinase 2